VSRVLLLGLDGATYNVLGPAFEAGHMPRLRSLLERGGQGVLESTVPPYTPPGWTSIFTGVNPGRHGIFGFTLGHVQEPRGLVRLDRVRSPAIWNAADAQGARMGLFNIPMTYPAPPVSGWAVSGMLTPEGGGETPDNFTWPDELAAKIAGRVGRYEIDVEVNYDEDWKSTAILERLSANLTTKRRALHLLLEESSDVSLLFAVLEAPDRLMHCHYKYIDPRCEHYSQPAAEPIRARAWDFFDEMDAVITDLLAWVGPDGFIVTMSDHGFGPKDKVVNVNLLLREWGLLSVRAVAALGSAGSLRSIARRAKSVVPRTVWRRAKSAAHAAIDWAHTNAFASPNPQQGIYVNLQGREPHGIVAPADYERVRDEIAERFAELTDPGDGRPVLDRMYRREEVAQGPEAGSGPDLYPVCRDYTYELSDGLYSASTLTDYRSLPRGFHHSDGIFGLAGPGIEPRAGLRARVYDIAPTALYLAGLKLPEVDGRVIAEALPPAMLEDRPPRTEAMDLPRAGEGAEAKPYSAEEEAQIEESLRNLGYL
jgi:predicted AlkP superfamily phosphohydrolase/phosphomutase